MIDFTHHSGFGLVLNKTNERWFSFCQSAKLPENKGVYSIAKYFYDNLNWQHIKQLLPLPMFETLTSFSEDCLSLSQTFIENWNTIYSNLLQDGEECLISMPGYSCEIAEGLPAGSIIDSLLTKLPNFYSPVTKSDYVKLVEDIFVLRFGFLPQESINPQYYLPCLQYVQTKHAPSANNSSSVVNNLNNNANTVNDQPQASNTNEKATNLIDPKNGFLGELSDSGIKFLASYEELRLTVYQDQGGKSTIGYGHLIKPGENFSKGITETQALALYKQDISIFVKAVNDSVKIKLTQHQFDALVILAYNIGPSGFKGSDLLGYLNNSDFTNVKKQWMLWNKVTNQKTGKREVSRGLTNRRTEEFEIFEGGDYVRTR